MNPALAAIRADMDRQRKLFDFRTGNLGADLCKAATDGVQECLDGQHAPDGSAWPPLSPAYDQWKQAHFPGEPMGRLHGLMADPAEVAGEVDVREDSATVTYGVSDEARAEADGFQMASGTKPARPFWGFTPDSLAEAGKILDARFDTIR